MERLIYDPKYQKVIYGAAFRKALDLGEFDTVYELYQTHPNKKRVDLHHQIWTRFFNKPITYAIELENSRCSYILNTLSIFPLYSIDSVQEKLEFLRKYHSKQELLDWANIVKQKHPYGLLRHNTLNIEIGLLN